jgi:CDP-2,3-bis-(O-geranylgeranyl)-sn-glycerol synthase
MNTLELVLLFLIPCWIINIGLNIFKFLPGIQQRDKPFDFGKNFFDKQRILGDSTTWFGLAVAIFFGVVIESFLTNWRIGLLKGVLVFFGHALGSFIKRRLGYSGGRFLPIIDHGDYIILTGVVFYFFGILTMPIVIWAIIVNYFVHPILCYFGFKLGLREKML